MKKIFSLFLISLMVHTVWAQSGEGYDPQNPGDPNMYYSLNVGAFPESGGSVSPAGRRQLSPGEEIYCRAEAKLGYEFKSWMVGDSLVSTDSQMYFTMPEHDVVLTAHFDWIGNEGYDPQDPEDPFADGVHYRHKVTLYATPSVAGYFNSSNFYLIEGESTDVYAYSRSGYRFDSWMQNGTVISTSNPMSITMGTENLEYTAQFVYDPENPANPADSIIDPYIEAYIRLQKAIEELQETLDSVGDYVNETFRDSVSNRLNEAIALYEEGELTGEEANELADELKLLKEMLEESIIRLPLLEEIEALKACKDTLLAAYNEINANRMSILADSCEIWKSLALDYLQEVDSLLEGLVGVSDSLIAEINSHLTLSQAFRISCEAEMEDYLPAFRSLHAAMDTVAVIIEEYSGIASQESLDFAGDLLEEVRSDYPDYDVPTAELMADSLLQSVVIVKNSVAVEMSLTLDSLRNLIIEIKNEINQAIDETGAQRLQELVIQADNLLESVDNLQNQVNQLLAENKPVSFEMREEILQLKEEIELFKDETDEMIESYRNAYRTLGEAIEELHYALEETGAYVPDSIREYVAGKLETAKEVFESGILSDVEAYELAAELRALIDLLDNNVQTDDITIETTEPGRLEDLILHPDEVETLRVIGPLNGTDIAFIRERLPKLSHLDIEKAWIVEGGDPYLVLDTKEDLRTKDLTIGKLMFSDMPVLESLILCDSTVCIENDIILASAGIDTIQISGQVAEVWPEALHGCNQHIYAEWTAMNAEIPEGLFGIGDYSHLLYATEGVTWQSPENIVVNGRAERILLHGNDECGIYIPQEIVADEISYTRSFDKQTMTGTAAGWESIILPFDVTEVISETRGEIASYSSGRRDVPYFWLLHLTDEGYKGAAMIEANVPYLIAMPNSHEYREEYNISGSVTFRATNDVRVRSTLDVAPVECSEFSLIPTYERIPESEEFYVINDEIYEGYLPGSVFVRGLHEVRPFECGLMIADTSDAPAFIPVIGASTGISSPTEILPEMLGNGIYNLHGQPVKPECLQRGQMYIINGLKVRL